MAEKAKRTSVELYDEDAEASVVTTIILDPSLLSKLDIDADDFHNITYKTIFLAELAIKQRGEEITETSVTKETAKDIDAFVIPKLIAQLEADVDILKSSYIIQEFSKKRKLIKVASSLINAINDGAKYSQQLIDDLQSEVEALRFPSDISRMVYFTSCRIRTSDPPTYVFTIKTLGTSKFYEADLTSAELDSPRTVKRKIREKAHINPILPKGYDALIHKLITNAKLSEAPKEASLEGQVCFWIKEWFKTAIEAKSVDELMMGYFERYGKYYFKSEPIVSYLNKKGGIKISANKLWIILEKYSGEHDKQKKLGGMNTKVYSLPSSFFEEEEEKGEEQLGLEQKEDDMSWMEGG